jgi:hypothetical protein
VVGERVGQLGRQGPDLAANAPEIVEQLRALLGQLGQELGEPENVDALIIFRRSGSGPTRRFLLPFGRK